MDVKQIFSKRFFELIDSHPTHPEAKYFQRIGMARSNYYSWKDPQNKAMPNATTIAKIARDLGTTPSYLLGFDDAIDLKRTDPATSAIERQAEKLLKSVIARASSRMSFDMPLDIRDVLSWWRFSEGKLQNMESIQAHVDLFEVPDAADQYLRPLSMGAQSLASTTLKANNPKILRKFMDSLERAHRDQIVASYAAAGSSTLDQEIKISDHKISVGLEELGARFDLHYWKLMLPVTDGHGNRYVLNYSTPVS